MSTPSNPIRAALDALDGADSLSEVQIRDALRPVIKDLGGVEALDPEALADYLAVSFNGTERNLTETAWRGYFGPVFTGQNEKGDVVIWPSIDHIKPDMIPYWAERSKAVSHPLLRSIYADLAWDFSRAVTGDKIDVEYARMAIDAYLQLASEDKYDYDIFLVDKLKRALSLAIMINDPDRIQRAKDTILKFSSDIAEDDAPGYCGIAFDVLLDNPKVPLTDDERRGLIAEDEARLSRTTGLEGRNIDGNAAEHCALRLAAYYRKHQQPDDLRRVLIAWGDAVQKLTESVPSMVAAARLEKVYETYCQYGLTKEAHALEPALRESGVRATKEMQQVKHEFEIRHDELEQIASQILGEDLTRSLENVALAFVPDKDGIEDRVKSGAKKTPLLSLMKNVIVNTEGMPVAEVGSVHDDLDGRVAVETGQDLQLSRVHLAFVIESLRKRFDPSADDLVEVLAESPVFADQARPLLQRALKAYLDDDHITAVHVLTPQIERAVRQLAVLVGAPIQKLRPRDSRGGRMYRQLGDLLREELIVATLGEKLAHYLRILLTDQRGWNMRNLVCHGLVHAETCNRMVSDRLLHALALLAQVQEREPSET